MSIELKPAIAPAYLKWGLFGKTGTGKTYTTAKVLSQFLVEFAPDSQIAMFDTEGGGGYVGEIVKKITGKELLVITSHAFSDLLEFTKLCKEKGYIGFLDSSTHVWRELCKDYLDAKKSRVEGAGGRVETTRLSLKDWGPIKDIWNAFANCFRYDPVHFAVCGREGDVWELVADETGEKELTKTGVKMKAENEFSYESSLLVQMKLFEGKHRAIVVKDRADILTGQVADDPDIEFFRPHFDYLNIGGKHAEPAKDPPKTFEAGEGPNWQTILARRTAVLDSIKDDLLLVWPSTSAADKKAKVLALRATLFTSSWTELEKDTNKHTLEKLQEGRQRLLVYIKEQQGKVKDNAANSK